MASYLAGNQRLVEQKSLAGVDNAEDPGSALVLAGNPQNCFHQFSAGRFTKTSKESLPMITRRDLVVAVTTVCVTMTAVTLADSAAKPIMRSSVFNWADLKTDSTKYGAKRQVFDARTATLDGLECRITTLNPGEVPHAAHQHSGEELIIIKEGTLEAMQNGVTNRAGPGAIIFEASNELHGLRNPGPMAATYYVIKFSPGILKDKTQ